MLDLHYAVSTITLQLHKNILRFLLKHTMLPDIQWFKNGNSMNACLKPQQYSLVQHGKSQSEYTPSALSTDKYSKQSW